LRATPLRVKEELSHLFLLRSALSIETPSSTTLEELLLVLFVALEILPTSPAMLFAENPLDLAKSLAAQLGFPRLQPLLVNAILALESLQRQIALEPALDNEETIVMVDAA
jgi:hypothetical protein